MVLLDNIMVLPQTQSLLRMFGSPSQADKRAEPSKHNGADFDKAYVGNEAVSQDGWIGIGRVPRRQRGSGAGETSRCREVQAVVTVAPMRFA